MRKLLIFGTDDSAIRLAFDVERWGAFEVAAFVGAERPETLPRDCAFVAEADVRSMANPDTWAFAPGTERHLNQDRLASLLLAKGSGVRIASIVSPGASVAKGVRVRENTYIGDGCHVLPGANLGANVWMEGDGQVGIGAKIGASSWLAIGARVGDHASIGRNCTMSRLAVVANGVTLPAWSLIDAMGSVDRSPSSTVFRDPLFRAEVVLRGTAGLTANPFAPDA